MCQFASLSICYGSVYDGLFNCKSVACVFYCVADIDPLANKKIAVCNSGEITLHPGLYRKQAQDIINAATSISDSAVAPRGPGLV